MKLAIKKATTDVTLYLFILDSSVTTGAGKTGLVFNSAGLVAHHVRPLAAAVALTLATQTVTGAHADGGFVEVDATNMPGVYRLDLSDAICATGVNSVVVMLKGATGMAPVALEIQLVSYDPNDTVRLGLTALPNAAADAAGGLAISDVGGLDMDAQRSDVAAILVDTGTTLDGRIPDVVAGAAGGLFIAGSNAATTVNITGNLTGNVSGSVGSVTAGVTLAASAIQAIWDALTSALATVGSIGKKLADLVLHSDNKVIIAGTTHTGAVVPTATAVTNDVGITQAGADKVWSTATRALTDKVGFALSAAGIQAIWDALTSALTAAGSIGKKLADWTVGTIDTYTGNTKQTGDAFARLGAPAGASVNADIAAAKVDTAAIKLKTDNLPTSPAAVGSAMTLTAGERNSIADAYLDRADGIETGLTPRQCHRLEVAAAAGKISGAASTTVVIRNAVADSKARLTATVDADGNRSAVTADLT